MKILTAALTLLGLILPARGRLPAQEPGKDPMKKIQELFKKAEKAMDKIDDDLLGADPVKAGDPAKVKKSLREARKNQEVVVKTIEEILKNLPPSQSGGGAGSCDKSSAQSKPKPKPKTRPKPREKKPDIVKKGKKKQDRTKKGGKKPKSRGKTNAENAKKAKGKRPPRNPAGKKRPQGGTETWGNLPLFLRDVFREEEAPRLPPKYLPFWKAFLKRGREKR